MNGPLRFNKAASYDIVTLGELLVDFTDAGRSADGQRLFEQNAGGAVANMVSAAARFGLKTAFIGKVGDDMHGHFLKKTLDDVGVDTDGLMVANDVFTTLAFVALTDGEREFSFARKPGADTCLTKDEVRYDLIEDARIFHVGSLSLTDRPVRDATMEALARAKEKGVVVSYDPNYRASLWPSAELASVQMRSVLPFVDVMKLSDEETALLTGIAEPEAAARKLIADGATCVAVTLGKAGALVCVGGDCQIVEGYDIPAVDTTGAGDAFWGGFLYKMLTAGKNPAELTVDDAAQFARFGNATATLCVTRRGGIPAMPELGEVKELIQKYG